MQTMTLFSLEQTTTIIAAAVAGQISTTKMTITLIKIHNATISSGEVGCDQRGRKSSRTKLRAIQAAVMAGSGDIHNGVTVYS